VRARTGERICLEHIRIGGKIFTTANSIEEFGRRLAAADAAYFESQGEHNGDAQVQPITSSGPTPTPGRRRHAKSQPNQEHIERALHKAGL